MSNTYIVLPDLIHERMKDIDFKLFNKSAEDLLKEWFAKTHPDKEYRFVQETLHQPASDKIITSERPTEIRIYFKPKPESQIFRERFEYLIQRCPTNPKSQ